MRLKEDNTSWNASSILKRDFRHDHSENKMLFRSHKNTKKWCRGKVGVEHVTAWHKHTWLFGEVMYVGKCKNCGKKFFKDSRSVDSILAKDK
jgi:hypothetical protein